MFDILKDLRFSVLNFTHFKSILLCFKEAQKHCFKEAQKHCLKKPILFTLNIALK